MRVAILVLEHSSPAGALVVWDMFSMAGAARLPEGENISGMGCQADIVSIDGKPITYSNFMEIKPHASIDDTGTVDMIVVPSGGYRVNRLSKYPENLKGWISANHMKGVPVAGICTGVFLLAESGILDGKMATTHWAFSDVFRKQFPKVLFSPEKMITKDQGVFCSGGGSAGVDLTLFLIETYMGEQQARRLSKMLLLERGRSDQSPYMESRFNKNHQDGYILKAQQYIENKIADNLAMDHVADHVGMSLRNFKRRFKAATGEAPLAYLQKLRMEKAKIILEHDDISINVLAEKVGYEDLGFFRKLFARHTGVSPRDYRKRFRNCES